MTKRILSLLLAVLLVLPGLALAQDDTTVTVGTFTRPSGYFFGNMFGSNTSDQDVGALLHGLSTVAWTHDQSYALDRNVVAGVDIRDNESGSRVYTFKLRSGLKYSDGSKVTAKDYVFSILLQSSGLIDELGGSATAYSNIFGWKKFHDGTAKEFGGVHLISDTRFSLTIQSGSMPYYYELVLVNVTPIPMSVVAPDCSLKDKGKGTYLSGDLTAETLKATLLDPATGYMSHPSVTSGPYKLEAYDAATGEVTLRINDYYPGNYEGQKPTIPVLKLKSVTYAAALDMLKSGELDTVNKATDGSFIQEAKAESALTAVSYPRSGYAFLAYACEEDVTGSLKVRQAIAHCLDRDAFIKEFLNGEGYPVYSYYGLGQWITEGKIDEIDVTKYAYDTDAAVKLLEEDGWKLNEKGEAFKAGTDTVRYRKANGGLQALEIRYAQVKDNAAAKLVADSLGKTLQSIGFKFDVTEVTFDELLTHYYRQTDRTYNLMFLATNFGMVFDPYDAFNPDEAYRRVNASGIDDEQLFQLAKTLRKTKPGDETAYRANWLKLMQRFSEVLPNLPIYTNNYYDFTGARLTDYAPDSQWSWTSAMLYAGVTE